MRIIFLGAVSLVVINHLQRRKPDKMCEGWPLTTFKQSLDSKRKQQMRSRLSHPAQIDCLTCHCI